MFVVLFLFLGGFVLAKGDDLSVKEYVKTYSGKPDHLKIVVWSQEDCIIFKTNLQLGSSEVNHLSPTGYLRYIVHDFTGRWVSSSHVADSAVWVLKQKYKGTKVDIVSVRMGEKRRIAKQWLTECRGGNMEHIWWLRHAVFNEFKPEQLGGSEKELLALARPEALKEILKELTEARKGNDGAIGVRSFMFEFRFRPEEFGSTKEELIKLMDEETERDAKERHHSNTDVQKEKEFSRRIIEYAMKKVE